MSEVNKSVISSKIESMIGFAIRSGKILYGLDRLESRGKKYLIFMDKNAGNNTAKSVHRIASENKIPLFLCNNPLDDLVHKTNCKVIALTDKNMAMGVLKCVADSKLQGDSFSEDYIEVK